MRVKCLAVGVLAWGLTKPVLGEPVPASFRTCRSVAAVIQRLSCYDAAVDRSTEPDSVPGQSAPPRAAMSVEPEVPKNAAPAALPMFSAKVAALSFRPSGAANVALDNGQVWTQYGPQGRVPLKVGDTVTLRPGLFGASVLVGPSGWITKVHLMPAAAPTP